MIRKSLVICILLALAISFAAAEDIPLSHAKLSAADIVDKNVAARGGLQAWRAVQTMSFAGKLGAGGNHRDTLPVASRGRRSGQQTLPSRPIEEVQLPFVIEMKRPRKMRVEIEFANDKALQVYDGANGWKLRPFLGRRDVEPFSTDEMKAASMESELDGPLVDYATKGTQVDLVGVEKVEGHDAYKLRLTMKGGQVRHLWVDAQTFLEVKIEGVPRRMDGKMRPVEIYYRDYKSVNGLMVPYVLETAVQGVQGATLSHKMTIENVVVNPKLEDSLFAKPSGKK
jgi:outer membrane lipoprotein-sorting protein